MIAGLPGSVRQPGRKSGTSPSTDGIAMRIYYMSPFNLRERRRTTNRVSDVRLCRSLAMNGAEARLVTPYAYRRDNVAGAAVLGHHGIAEPLGLDTLPTPLWGAAPRWVTAPVWTVAVLTKYLTTCLMRGGGGPPRSIWISRDHNAIMAILLANRVLGTRAAKAVYWAHEYLPRHRRIAWIYRNSDGILATNSAILDDLERDLGVSKERTAVTLNPVSGDLFRERPNREVARRNLGIPPDDTLVVYTGKLGRRLREAEYILEAARLLPDYTFVLTGGTADGVSYWTRRCEDMGVGNVKLTGYLPSARDIRDYQVAADAVVSYYTTENKLLDYNYPQKMTEYMASGAPIVTPNCRATQDVLHAANAEFVEPESSRSLAAGIRRVVEDRAYARALADRAYRDAKEITLEKRGAQVLTFLHRLRGT
jgi:glycosyltransferase involved in cell wall biosynthesis